MYDFTNIAWQMQDSTAWFVIAYQLGLVLFCLPQKSSISLFLIVTYKGTSKEDDQGMMLWNGGYEKF